jgi:DtxR family transcriptional regulator, Mn-dependent transcriptional regulator
VYFNMAIQKASEDYLEAMLMMKEKHGYIRSIDVAEKLNVTKPSVSYATKRLKESGHITMDKDGLITLTETGMQVATEMLKRHKALTKFLIILGVDEETAQEDACKLEHDLSQKSFDAIYSHAARMIGKD